MDKTLLKWLAASVLLVPGVWCADKFTSPNSSNTSLTSAAGFLFRNYFDGSLLSPELLNIRDEPSLLSHIEYNNGVEPYLIFAAVLVDSLLRNLADGAQKEHVAQVHSKFLSAFKNYQPQSTGNPESPLIAKSFATALEGMKPHMGNLVDGVGEPILYLNPDFVLVRSLIVAKLVASKSVHTDAYWLSYDVRKETTSPLVPVFAEIYTLWHRQDMEALSPKDEELLNKAIDKVDRQAYWASYFGRMLDGIDQKELGQIQDERKRLKMALRGNIDRVKIMGKYLREALSLDMHCLVHRQVVNNFLGGASELISLMQQIQLIGLSQYTLWFVGRYSRYDLRLGELLLATANFVSDYPSKDELAPLRGHVLLSGYERGVQHQEAYKLVILNTVVELVKGRNFPVVDFNDLKNNAPILTRLVQDCYLQTLPQSLRRHFLLRMLLLCAPLTDKTKASDVEVALTSCFSGWDELLKHDYVESPFVDVISATAGCYLKNLTMVDSGLTTLNPLMEIPTERGKQHLMRVRESFVRPWHVRTTPAGPGQESTIIQVWTRLQYRQHSKSYVLDGPLLVGDLIVHNPFDFKANDSGSDPASFAVCYDYATNKASRYPRHSDMNVQKLELTQTVSLAERLIHPMWRASTLVYYSGALTVLEVVDTWPANFNDEPCVGGAYYIPFLEETCKAVRAHQGAIQEPRRQ